MNCSIRRFVLRFAAAAALVSSIPQSAVYSQNNFVAPAAHDPAAPLTSPVVPLPAGDPATDSSSASTEKRWASPQAAIEDGRSLEDTGLWGDAIRHYEAANRQWKQDKNLQRRLLICRLHFDVNRRYEDQSFLQSIGELPASQTLDLYAEVLANLETHYVESPQWSQILRYGTASLEVALSEPAFVATHLAGVDPRKVESFRQNVHRQIISRPANTRFDLRAHASHVASVARRELGLSSTAVLMEYVCGAISTLDPYSRFLTSSQLDDTFSNIEGNFVGLGVELKSEGDRLKIINVIPGGPAEEFGLLAGDAIVSVAGMKTKNNDPDDVADMLRGPEDSLVAIDLVKQTGETISLQVPRRRVEVPSVENVQIIDADSGTGYFRLTNFQMTTTRDIENALWSLHRQGMRQLIMDLRGNPGGLLSTAVEVADRFVEQGRIVSTRGRNVRENFEYFAHRPKTWNVPLYVLIDGDSASASEIFAGAIRDSERGVLIGQRTYGKGSVQGIFRMEKARAGLCLTTAKFFSPKNVAISEQGVEPHVPVMPTHIMARPTDDGRLATTQDDAILIAAIERARNQSRISRLP